MRACLRCHISLSLSGIDELMASALLWSVRTTAILWARGWWDAKSRYLSVCVDFLYTVVRIDPSGSRCNRTSRKGSLPSNSILTVNCMLGSTLFRWSRSSFNLLTGSAIHVSSTYPCQLLWCWLDQSFGKRCFYVFLILVGQNSWSVRKVGLTLFSDHAYCPNIHPWCELIRYSVKFTLKSLNIHALQVVFTQVTHSTHMDDLHFITTKICI